MVVLRAIYTSLFKNHSLMISYKMMIVMGKSMMPPKLKLLHNFYKKFRLPKNLSKEGPNPFLMKIKELDKKYKTIYIRIKLINQVFMFQKLKILTSGLKKIKINLFFEVLFYIRSSLYFHFCIHIINII